MRIMAAGMIQVLILTAVLFAMQTSFREQAYKENLEQSLTAAIRNVLTASHIQEESYLDSVNAMYGELIGELSVQFLEAEWYEVTVYRLDAQTGEADIEIKVPMKDFMGKVRTLSVRKYAAVQ